MQLVLEPPRGGKSWIFFANDLAHDKGFVAYEPCYSRIPDSERWTVNQYLREAAEEFGIKPHIFNQCQWEGSPAGSSGPMTGPRSRLWWRRWRNASV